MGDTYLKEDCCVVLVDAFEDDDEAVTSGGVAPAIDMTTCRRASSMSRGLDVSRARKCSSRDSCTMGMDATVNASSLVDAMMDARLWSSLCVDSPCASPEPSSSSRKVVIVVLSASSRTCNARYLSRVSSRASMSLRSNRSAADSAR